MNKAWSSAACCLLLVVGCATIPSFTVLTDPSGADIYVDGALVGKTPATIKVEFKENAQMVTEKKILMVKLPGYKVRKEVISLEGVSNKTLDLILVTESKNKAVSDIASKPTATTKQVNQSIAKDVVTKPSLTAAH